MKITTEQSQELIHHILTLADDSAEEAAQILAVLCGTLIGATIPNATGRKIAALHLLEGILHTLDKLAEEDPQA